MFISGRLVNPVASDSFLGGPLGLRVLLTFAGLRLTQWPQTGSASKPCVSFFRIFFSTVHVFVMEIPHLLFSLLGVGGKLTESFIENF